MRGWGLRSLGSTERSTSRARRGLEGGDAGEERGGVPVGAEAEVDEVEGRDQAAMTRVVGVGASVARHGLERAHRADASISASRTRRWLASGSSGATQRSSPMRTSTSDQSMARRRRRPGARSSGRAVGPPDRTGRTRPGPVGDRHSTNGVGEGGGDVVDDDAGRPGGPLTARATGAGRAPGASRPPSVPRSRPGTGPGGRRPRSRPRGRGRRSARPARPRRCG